MILFRRDHSQRNRALNLSQEKPAAEIDTQDQENATSEEARPEHFLSGDEPPSLPLLTSPRWRPDVAVGWPPHLAITCPSLRRRWCRALNLMSSLSSDLSATHSR